jgi:FKBP-type peptidyl-prolyl cis-trans isomerase FklB
MNISYSLGMLVADNFKNQGFGNLDANELAAGIVDMLAGQPKIPVEAAAQIYEDYAQEMGAKQFEQKLAEGQMFMMENGKRAGITTTATGLQY